MESLTRYIRRGFLFNSIYVFLLCRHSSVQRSIISLRVRYRDVLKAHLKLDNGKALQGIQQVNTNIGVWTVLARRLNRRLQDHGVGTR